MNSSSHSRQLDLVVVGGQSSRKALRRVSSCEQCAPLAASYSFTSVMDAVLERKPGETGYVLDEPATCPSCGRQIFENTLVSFSGVVAADRQTVKSNPDTNTFVVDETQLSEAQAFVTGCECCAADAVISFDYVLDAITGCDPCVTEYVMSHPAQCPRCSRDVTEKTLIIPG